MIAQFKDTAPGQMPRSARDRRGQAESFSERPGAARGCSVTLRRTRGSEHGMVCPGSLPIALIAGWSSPVSRQAHNLKDASSNLAPATIPVPAQAGKVRSVGARTVMLSALRAPAEPAAVEVGRGQAPEIFSHSNSPALANETRGGTGDDCSVGKRGVWPLHDGQAPALRSNVEPELDVTARRDEQPKSNSAGIAMSDDEWPILDAAKLQAAFESMPSVTDFESADSVRQFEIAAVWAERRANGDQFEQKAADTRIWWIERTEQTEQQLAHDDYIDAVTEDSTR